MGNENEVYYYDSSTHRRIQEIMQKGENLNIRFFVDKSKVICVWASSASYPQKFKVALMGSIGGLILNYLQNGECGVVEQNPKNLEVYSADKDYQFEFLKEAIGFAIPNLVPVFRDTNGRISGFYPLKHGNIFLNFKQTEEALDFLRTNNIIL